MEEIAQQTPHNLDKRPQTTHFCRSLPNLLQNYLLRLIADAINSIVPKFVQCLSAMIKNVFLSPASRRYCSEISPRIPCKCCPDLRNIAKFSRLQIYHFPNSSINVQEMVKFVLNLAKIIRIRLKIDYKSQKAIWIDLKRPKLPCYAQNRPQLLSLRGCWCRDDSKTLQSFTPINPSLQIQSKKNCQILHHNSPQYPSSTNKFRLQNDTGIVWPV